MKRFLFSLTILTALIAGTLGAYNIIEVPEAIARTVVVVTGQPPPAPGGGTATKTAVSATGYADYPSGSQATGSATGGNWSSGSLLVATITVGSGSGTTTGVTLNSQNFTQVTGASISANGTYAEIWYLANNTATGTQAATASWSGSMSYVSVDVIEFTGMATSNVLDISTEKSATTATVLTTTAGTPAQSGEVFIAVFNVNGDGGATSIQGSPATWTEFVEASGYGSNLYYISSSTGSHYAQQTIASTKTYIAVMASFKPSP